ncbi:MAG: AAA family ATPase [Nanoarchaeota archaeon]|nr:AAA family ATPase [Nanoarchaeota archaeon]
MKVIVISGSVGIGKEKLAKYLVKKLSFIHLDLHHHYSEISNNYNQKKKCYDVDLKKFEKLVEEKIKELKKKKAAGLIVDSHISHLLPKKMVDLCVILTNSNLKKLKKQLEKRKYSQKKVRENLDTEIFQVCLIEAQERKHKIIVFNLGKRISKREILKRIKTKLKK